MLCQPGQAVPGAALGCPGAVPGGLCFGRQSRAFLRGGVRNNGVMPSWHREKQEKVEVTRNKKTWCLGLGGGQPPAGERL